MKLEELSNRKSWLAPLAGFTDQAFRTLCRRHQADVLVSEMVSADGLSRDSAKTRQLIHFESFERPYVVQIFGSDPLVMAKAAEICLEFQPDMLDINMGCPVKKVIKRGAGSALMTDPQRAARIVKEVKKALAGKIPLSVKFRSGWDSQNLNYLDFGLLMQDSGADILCLHPRTAKQMFGGTSNWEHITKLAKVIQIPLIGNGDVDSPEAAIKMYDDTGCHSIMIGRAALGKPWIFSQIKELESKGNYQALSTDLLKSTMLEHLDLALSYKPEWLVIKEMRSQLSHYLTGFTGAKDFRRQLNVTTELQQLRELINSLG